MVQCAHEGCGRRMPTVLTNIGRLGTYVDEDWYCSSTCVEETVRRRIKDLPPVEPAYIQCWRPMRLGQLLRSQLGLTKEEIEAALGAHRMGTPIGQRLREAGLVSAEDVLRALATQAGVRYLTTVDPRVVALRPGELPVDVVRTLGIVPISADPEKREMQVACAAPVPGLAVRAVTKLTNWAVEPLLVTDETLPRLIDLYTSLPGERRNGRPDVCDLRTAPARVAQFAKEQRSVRVSYERCDPYVWVRLSGESATADLLTTTGDLRGGY